MGKPASIDSIATVKHLGRELLLSRSNINNCPVLLSLISSSLPSSSSAAAPSSLVNSVDCLIEAIRCLQAFFLPLLRSRDLSGTVGARKIKNADSDLQNGQPTADAIYKAWISDKYREFVKLMLKVIAELGTLPTAQVAALNALMEIIRSQGEDFNRGVFSNACRALVGTPGFNNDILGAFISEHCKCVEVCYFTYVSVEKLILQHKERQLKDKMISSDKDEDTVYHHVSNDTFARNIYDLLSHVPPLDASGKDLKGEDTLREGKSSLKKKLPLKLTKTWLAFLQLPLPIDVYKKVLTHMHTLIMPYLSSPIHLSDFLTRSYDIGGLISVMALNGLFILITKYGLEYPNFYNKLYALLEPSIFVAKHRASFFGLLDTCLKSSHLPAYLAGAFAKRLSRLALSVPPAGALVIVALIHNLLRRHPSINCLVHWDDLPFETNNTHDTAPHEAGKLTKRGVDLFLPDESDVEKCNALQSSLWEMETLRHHYCPAVSRFIASLETDLTVRARTTEVLISDFSSGSYTTIFSEETGRRLKQVPLAFYKTTPTKLFPSNLSSDTNDDFVGWDFGCPPIEQKLEETIKEHSGAGKVTIINGSSQKTTKSRKRKKSA